ncbi:hypothetical protein IBX73_07525 [candidate division WOR-3 bacterium]|nr:hypothetical protein [candidate division WOR-3 bacterium]
MKNALSRMTTGEPVFLRNLTLYPVGLASSNGAEVASVDEVLRDELGEFRELDTPRVDEIEFDNRSDKPVLMLDGEEITGSLQNRIIAASTYVEPHSARSIGVICAEEDRWDKLGAFTTGCCSYPGVRAILSGRGRRKDGLQQTVWDEIERKLTVTRTRSATSSMHDIYDNLEDEVGRYVEGFHGLNHNTIGFIGVAGGKILGCDVFAGPATYRKYESRLLRSYALDAIEHRRPDTVRHDARRFFDKIRQGLANKRFSRRSHHFTLKGRGFSGQGIHDQAGIVHLSAFPG